MSRTNIIIFERPTNKNFGHIGVSHAIKRVFKNGIKNKKSQIPSTHSSFNNMGSSSVKTFKKIQPSKIEIESDARPDSMLRRRVEGQISFSASIEAINGIEYKRQKAPIITELKKQKSFLPKVTLTEKKNNRNKNKTLTTKTGTTGSIFLLLIHAAVTIKIGSKTPITLYIFHFRQRRESDTGKKIKKASGMIIAISKT